MNMAERITHIGQVLEPLVREARPAPGNEKWHVVRLRSGSERKAGEFLKAREFGVYLPRTRIWRVVAQRFMSPSQRRANASVRRPQEVPIYPGYLFLKFDIDRGDWERTFDFLGVSGLMCRYDVPTVIRSSEIERVKGYEVEGVIPSTLSMQQVLFEVGETVRVNSGPFASFSGVIEQLPAEIAELLKSGSIEEFDDSMRAKVAVNIFGRATLADLALSQIEKI